MKSLKWMLLGAALLGSSAAMAAESDRDKGAREYFTDLEVVDQNGNKLRFFSDVLKGRVVLINVIFTNCVSACPLVTQLLSVTRDELVPSVKDEVWFVSISVDPERDTPEALKAFAKRQDVDESRWLFLTGDKQNIDHILGKIKRYTPDIDAHSTQLLAGTTRGRHEWIPLPAGAQPGAIAAVMRSLVEQHPG